MTSTAHPTHSPSHSDFRAWRTFDLAPKNLEKLTKTLAPFIEHASKKPWQRTFGRPQAGTKPQRGYDLVQLREWAGKNKITVPRPAAVSHQRSSTMLAAGGR